MSRCPTCGYDEVFSDFNKNLSGLLEGTCASDDEELYAKRLEEMITELQTYRRYAALMWHFNPARHVGFSPN